MDQIINILFLVMIAMVGLRHTIERGWKRGAACAGLMIGIFAIIHLSFAAGEKITELAYGYTPQGGLEANPETGLIGGFIALVLCLAWLYLFNIAFNVEKSEE